MRKRFLSIVVFVMALCANAQTNQYFWYQGNLMMGNPIAQIDSVTFGEGEPADTLHILLPRTIIKEVHDTIYITIHDTVCPNDSPEGAMVGEFSVSATTKVHFSQGNLQYQASTSTWQFAAHQYDAISGANSNISNTYAGWIDLFGWGTGNNPTNASTNSNNYSTFVDWGVNPIINGGNEANAWRTLTKDEWVYLFCTRTNAATLFGLGSVNGKDGTILLPDNWTLPAGASFTASTTKGLEGQDGSYYNSNGNNFSDNTYTAEQWDVMESAGAVFLPAAGYRNGTAVKGVGLIGYYWSAMSFSTGNAYDLHIWSNRLNPQDVSTRDGGKSVRLVQDVEE